MNMHHALHNFRQWLFPAAFRIPVDGTVDWDDSLLALLLRPQSASDPVSAAPAPAPVSSSSGTIDDQFATKLCNSLHRLKRVLARLEKEDSAPREVATIRRVFERTDPLLETYGIRYADLTGQAYDDGRNDFEPIGRPEEVAGLSGKQISLCEYPVVYLQQRLVQRARGTVAVPARNTP